jgi:hypothetical protein
MPMTVKKYIECGCSKCPYCGSEQIHGCGLEAEGASQCSRMVSCGDCGQEWTEVFCVTNVLELDGGE